MKNLLKTMAAGVVLTLAACENEEAPIGGANDVSRLAQIALETKYPGASNVRWLTKGDYVVAVFSMPATRAVSDTENDLAAWFDNGGVWYMTETDIPFAQLPDAVKTAFQQGEYSTWKVDDVDMIERRDVETVYVIETEQGNSEVDLYYSPDGILVKTVLDAGGNDGYEDFIPSQPSSSVDAYVKEYYPSARILDIDREKGVTEVEILDGTVCRELLFDDGGAWMQTKTELRITALPDAVMAAIKASQYATYRIDDADFIETLTGEWYLVELESGKQEVKLRIDATGKIL